MSTIDDRIESSSADRDQALDAMNVVPPLDRGEGALARDGGRASIDLPASWQQGRGMFGGLVTGVLVHALERVAPDRALRSLTAELCGPVAPSRVELAVEVLRAGNAVTTAAVRLVQHGEVQAHGVGVLGRARAGATGHRIDLAPPAMRAWSDTPALPIAPDMPQFAQHGEYRITRGVPFAGNAEPHVEGWIRWRTPCAIRDAAYLAACLDSHWPCRYAIEPAPRPMATIAFTFQPLVREAPAGPLYYRGAQIAEDDGYCVELREIWSADGELLALNQQTFVVIK